MYTIMVGDAFLFHEGYTDLYMCSPYKMELEPSERAIKEKIEHLRGLNDNYFYNPDVKKQMRIVKIDLKITEL
jgi:hypothetical protein